MRLSVHKSRPYAHTITLLCYTRWRSIGVVQRNILLRSRQVNYGDRSLKKERSFKHTRFHFAIPRTRRNINRLGLIDVYNRPSVYCTSMYTRLMVIETMLRFMQRGLRSDRMTLINSNIYSSDNLLGPPGTRCTILMYNTLVHILIR